MVGTLVKRCRSAMSWNDLDLTFDLTVKILSLKLLAGNNHSNHKV